MKFYHHHLRFQNQIQLQLIVRIVILKLLISNYSKPILLHIYVIKIIVVYYVIVYINIEVIVHFIFVVNIIDIVLIPMIIFIDFYSILLMVMNLCQHNPVHMEHHREIVRSIISIQHENKKNLYDISVVLIVIIHRITVEMFGKNSFFHLINILFFFVENIKHVNIPMRNRKLLK